MSGAVSMNEGRPRNVGRSIFAFFAGFLLGIFLSLGTDVALNKIGTFPSLGSPMSSGLLLIATIYRTIYGVLGSYVIARLAPNRSMWHALIGGVVGLVLNIVGVMVTWNRGLGPHWYPLALTALAMPTAWLGGKLRVMQSPQFQKELE